MATPADAELLLKLYELRQDERMRTARNWVLHEFAPQSLDELLVVQRDFGSLHNQYWRQVISYWEMAAAFVLHGALDRDLFFDSVGENIYLLAKFGRLNQEYAQIYPGGFMPHTATAIEAHPASRDRCLRLRELLQARGKTP